MSDANDSALPQQIGIAAFREHLSGYLRQARQGESVLVTRNTRDFPPRDGGIRAPYTL